MDAAMPACATRTRSLPRSSRSCRLELVCVTLLLLAGCAVVPEEPPREPLTEIVAPQVAPRPVPVIAPAPAPAPKAPLAIIASGMLPAYLDVADSLVALLEADEYVIHVLDENSAATQPPIELTDKPRAVVAIGLQAALYAREHVDAPLVFCQVLNYSDYPELEQATAGISMLAAFDEQIAFWKAVDDSLEVVGTIVGPGHERLISESAAAAASHGISLDARTSNSDRETVYQFKRLSTEIDGFWLIPDNRILSVSAIEEVMAYAASRRLPVVVATPALLRFGALMSLTPSPRHVADSVYSVLGDLQTFIARGFEVVSPKGFEVDVNASVASRLGLGID